METAAPETEARRQAEALAGRRVRSLSRAGRGGNNRIYRVECENGAVFALKAYPAQASDPRDRLGTEFKALRFLRVQGIEGVPAAIGCAPASGFALYEWIDGTPVDAPDEADIDAAAQFVNRLASVRGVPGADAMPLASEACLSLAELCSQIGRRITRLREVAGPHAGLARFIAEDMAPTFRDAAKQARAGYARIALSADEELERSLRTLSPSDFGFHNALRCGSRGLRFLDFEYFGWDDPVKLAADFILHPGMELPGPLASRFRDGAIALFSGDRTFGERLRLTLPLYGLRWCAIVLNEFLPERWARRAYAQGELDAEGARTRQLGKAQLRLSAVRELIASR